MSFVGLSQTAAFTLLAATALAVIIFFFLKVQHRRFVVSSSLLWERVLEKRKRRSLLEILRKLLSLLIALAIGLSLAGAFAEAELDGDGEAVDTPRRVALVLDTRLNMTATTANGESRWQRAVALARRTLEASSGADRFLLADTGGRVLAAESRHRSAALAALDDLQPWHADFRWSQLDSGLEVVFITDGVALPRLPESVQTRSVFEAADNVALTAFEVRRVPASGRASEAYLEVTNFGLAAHEVRMEIRDDRGVQFRRTVTLQSRERYRNTFDVSTLEGGALVASASFPGAATGGTGDAFAADDVGYAFLPRSRATRLLLVTPGNRALRELLEELDAVELTVVAPENYPGPTVSASIQAAAGGGGGGDDFDGVILDRFAPPAAPRSPTMVIAPPDADWLPERRGVVVEPGFSISDEARAQQLLRQVAFDDVRVERAVRVDTTTTATTAAPAGSSEWRVLVGSSTTPLMLVREQPVPQLLLTFALEDSDIAGSLGFPIFVSNVVDWFRADSSYLRRVPGTVEVPFRATISRVRSQPVAGGDQTDPTDQTVEGRDIDGSTRFAAAQPGIYVARPRGGGSARAMPIAVSLAGAGISDIGRSVLAPGSEGAESDEPETLSGARRVWPALLLLAALLLVGEALTAHRRITL